MTPLFHAPSIIPQLILSLCTVSIATCNKLFENMTHFYGDKNKPKILGTIKGQTFYWNIDTGSAVTCMNINSFETSFGKKMNTQEKYKIDIFIKKRKCSHIVQITDKFSENILGIDFGLHFDHKTQQTQFLPNPSKALFTTKSFTMSLVQARSFQKINNEQNYLLTLEYQSTHWYQDLPHGSLLMVTSTVPSSSKTAHPTK